MLILRFCGNPNTLIGYKLTCYRENSNISILEYVLKCFLEHVKLEPLSIERPSLNKCLHDLSLAKCSQLAVNGLNSEEIDD